MTDGNETGTGYFRIQNNAVTGNFNCAGAVIIPNGVTSIGSAFDARYGNPDLGFSEGFSYGNFSGNTLPTRVTSLTIPSSVTTIGENAFRGSKLSSLTIPSSVTTIGIAAFEDATMLTSLTIQSGITSIGDRAFVNLPLLTSLTIPNTVTSIGVQAFFGATGLNQLTIGSGVTSIGDNAFEELSSLPSLTIPNSVSTIGIRAFAGASSLTSLTIGSGVTTIPDRAFQGISSLQSLTIPNTVTYLGGYAFAGGTALTTLIIGNGVTEIRGDEFDGATNLVSLNIGNGVTSLGFAAFEYERSMTTLVIGNGLIEISANCFRYVNLLTSLTIGSSVTTISDNAFEDANTLATLIIPNSVTSIYNTAFNNAYSLSSITIGNGLASIADNAFDGKSLLTSLTIGTGITSIGANAFKGATSLTSLTIPDNVTSIGVSAFEDASALTSLTIPNEVTSIGANAFKNASSLASLTLPNSLSTVGNYAFLGNAITNLVICKTLDLSNAGISTPTPSNCGGKTIADAPTIGLVTLTSPTTANVSFTAPTNNGGAAISRYTATSSTGNLIGSVSQAGSGTIAISGLIAGTTYTFTVVARNQVGNSLSSASSSAITAPTRPSVPTIGTVTLNGTTATIPFSAPSNGGSTITRYTATSDSGGFTGFVSQAGSGSVQVTGLESGTTYTFTVVARNQVGDSDASSPSNSVTVPAVPDSPTSVVATRVNSTSADITFIAPLNNGGSAITSYTATSSPGDITATTSQASDRTIRVTGLTDGETYTFTVVATNLVGISNPSDESNAILGTPYNRNTGNGTVACINDGQVTGAGYFTISNNIVTSSSNCQGKALIPDGVSEIAEQAFRNAYYLSSVVIPDTVESIGNDAFRRAYDLSSLILGSGLETIGDGAFRQTYSLTELIIPDSVISIGNYAFAYGEYLTSITLGANLQSIGNGAFEEQYELTSLSIPNSVTSIGFNAFAYAESLVSLTIGTGVGTVDGFIDVDAFYGTWNLITINYCGDTALNLAYLGVDSDVTVSCTPPTTYTITINSGANGAVAPGSSSAIIENSRPVYTITPNADYEIDTATVTGIGDIRAALTTISGNIKRYTFSAITSDQVLAVTFKLAPVSAPVVVAPTPVPYLKSLTAPKMNLKDGKLMCSAGTYNAGFTLSGVIQGSAIALFSPTSYTYNLLINGAIQSSLAVTTTNSSTSWNPAVSTPGSVYSCSVTVSSNSITTIDKSTDNTSGVNSALATQTRAILDADVTYKAALKANALAYPKALKDNRAQWTKEIAAIRANYYLTLNRIKANGGSKMITDATTAFNVMTAAKAKSNADYAESKPAAIAARDAANKAALDAKSAAIAKAKADYGTYIESIGYGVLLT